MLISVFKTQLLELLRYYLLGNAKLIINGDKTSKKYRIKWIENMAQI